LAASPALIDPNFARAVVLMVEHDGDGALGLILNRPLDQRAAALVPGLAEVLGPDGALHEGGPGQRGTGLIGLAEYRDRVVGGVALLDPEVGAEEVARARLYSGYAGWGPGQLEAELAAESWIVERALAEDIFDEDATTLWSRVVARKGGAYRLIASIPV